MVKPPVTPPRPVKRRRPVILWILIGVSCLCLLSLPFAFGAFFAGDINQTNFRAQKAEDEYRKVGLPWTKDEVVLRDNRDPKDDATSLLQDGMFWLKNEPELDKSALKSALANHEWAYVESLIKPYTKALESFVAGSKKSYVDFQRDWDNGSSISFPEFALIRKAVIILGARAALKATRGDQSGALADLAASYQLAKFSGSDPTIISLLVMMALQEATYQATVQSAELAANRGYSVEKFISRLQENRPQPNISVSLRGDAYMFLAVCRNIKPSQISSLESGEGPSGTNPSPIVREGLPKDPTMRAMAVRFMEFYTTATKILAKYPNDPRAATKEIDKVISQIDRKKSSNLMVLMFVPDFSQLGAAIVRDQAYYVATLTYLQALDYKRLHGHFPTSLDQLSGDHTDPFSGKPLKTAYVNNRFRIYSVGPDMKDDGGKIRSELGIKGYQEEGPQPGDVVVPTPS